MRNLHQILLQEYGLEARGLFRDWERLQLRASNYKNHRIFTFRCVHKDLIPVSIKLKSTLKTEKARKIIRKAEKDLLQERMKAINSILDNTAKQTEECRSQLASIISAQRLRECQGFINKVGEIRFINVKQRQLNKYNILLNKKEGNITRANVIIPINSNNLASQAGRQASTLLPPREGSNLSQTSRQAVTLLPSGEGSNLSQAGSQAGALLPYLPGNCSPSFWGRKQFISGRQAGRQVLSFPLGKEAFYPRQVVRQVLPFLIVKEAALPRPLLTFLPGKEAVSPGQLHSFLPGKEAILCQQLLTFLLGKEAVLPRLLLTFPLGKVTVLPRRPLILPWVIPKQVKQAIKLGQAGKASGVLPGIGHSRLPRRIVLPPREIALPLRKTTPPLPSPVGFPKGLLMKNLTLSGSLTYPVNL